MKDTILPELELLTTNNEFDTIPDGMSIPEAAEQVARGKLRLSPAQARMLIELLPFYLNKMPAKNRSSEDLATRLDDRLRRADKVRMIRLLPPPGPRD